MAQCYFLMLLPLVVLLVSLLGSATRRGVRTLRTSVLAYTTEEGEWGPLSPAVDRKDWCEGPLLPL